MNSKEKGNANIGIGACALVLGFVKLSESSAARPTGRWSLFFGALFDSFGPNGPAIASLVIGSVLITLGILIRGKK